MKKQIAKEENKNDKKYVLRKLFLSTLYLSTFTFGGGYVIVTLLKNKFVDELHWIDENEMIDLVAIAQSSPGAIAVNGAIVVGYKLAGFAGIICAIIGAVLPPLVILTVVSYFYVAFKTNFYIHALLNGMRSGVGAVIISVVYDMGKDVVKTKDPLLLIIMPVSFIANYFYNVNVIYIILLVALIGVIRTVYREHKKEKAS